MSRSRNIARSLRRPWLGRLVFVALLVAVLGYLAGGPPDRLDTGDKLASVGALILGAAALVLSVSPVRAVLLNSHVGDQQAADLAELVRRQWAREAAMRLLRRPEPLAVRWSTAAGRVVGDGGDERASGDAGYLAELFRRLPARRLVIVGVPGSGKSVSALLLTLDIIAARRSDEPVPVLLPVSSWDPHEDLDRWLVCRLVEEYPMLADRHRYGDDAVLRLVRAGRVLPILDGLDELPGHRRPAAIAALNTASAGRPIVLTCRDDTYAAAVAAAGMPLDGAVVVALEPVTVEAAAAYLPAGQVDGESRWAKPIAELRAHPGGPLARALATPLMIYLARTVYAAPGSDPAGLADRAQLPTAAHIEDHLLDRYLPAVYAAADLRVPRYHAEQARTWLSFLATRLPDPTTGDLAWWNLPRCVSRWRQVAGLITGSVAGLACGATAALTTTLVAGPGWGLLSGLVAGGYIGLMCGLGYGSEDPVSRTGRPRQLRLRLRTLLSPTRASMQRAAQCTLVIGLQVGSFVGIGIGLSRGVGPGIVYGAGMALLVGLCAGIIEYLAQNLTRLTDEPDLLSPRTSLASDRAACLLHASVGVLVLGPSLGLVVAAFTDPLSGLAAGLALTISSALLGVLIAGLPTSWLPGAGLQWVPFTIARTWLAVRRQTPLRLLRFLHDAHTRGVLRQEGAVYQFRHARVLEHLLAASATEPKAPADSGSRDSAAVAA